VTLLLWFALGFGVLAYQLWRECRPDPETLTRAQRDQPADLAWDALMRDVQLKLDAAAAERALTAVRCAMQRGVSVHVVAPDDLVGQEHMN